jgi:ribosomal protein S18 acetylase RimI-like enzyme
VDASVTRLAAARPGERWVLRHRLPDGSATDVIGWVERVESDTVRLSLLGGGQAEVRFPDVVRAHRVPAAPGGADPRRTSATELERHALPGWRVIHECLGDWTLRAAGGFTGRANSCLAVCDPGLPIEEAAAAVVAWSTAHGIAPRAQVVVGSVEDAALERLGWRPAHGTTNVLAARLAEFLGETLPDPRVRVSEELEADWEAAYRSSRAVETDPALARMILDGNPPRAFAGLPAAAAEVQEAGLLAIARGHVSGTWLGLAAIWTAPGHRRRGWAALVMRALGHWGARRGARSVYLQAAAENLELQRTYAGLGFVHHHSYRYLAPP